MNSCSRYLSLFLLMTAFASVLPAVTGTLPTRLPLAGEWNSNNPGHELGYYNTDTSTFVLCTLRATIGQLPCTAFATPISKTGRIPLLGRWSRNDTIDRPALYDPATGQLLTFHYLSCPPAECGQDSHLVIDQIYSLGVVGAAATSGDWNGDTIDTLALVVPNYKRQPGSSVGDVLLYGANHTSIDSVLLLDFDPSPYQVIAGRWPGNSPTQDHLGFYESTDRIVLLASDNADFRVLPIITPHSGLSMFGLTWGSNGDSVALYSPYRSGCSPSYCHRVDFYDVPPVDSLGSANSIVQVEDPNPLIDAVFPDDPVDPNP